MIALNDINNNHFNVLVRPFSSFLRFCNPTFLAIFPGSVSGVRFFQTFFTRFLPRLNLFNHVIKLQSYEGHCVLCIGSVLSIEVRFELRLLAKARNDIMYHFGSSLYINFYIHPTRTCRSRADAFSPQLHIWRALRSTTATPRRQHPSNKRIIELKFYIVFALIIFFQISNGKEFYEKV